MGEVPPCDQPIFDYRRDHRRSIVLLVYMYRKYKHTFRDWVAGSLDKGIRHFHSLGKVKFLLLSAFALFVVFISLTIGLIQDFLSQEFALFDEVASYIVHRTFGSEWSLWMDRFALLGSYYVYTPLIAVTVAWIILKGKDRLLELTFFAWVIVGGEMLDEGLRLLFSPDQLPPCRLCIPLFVSERTDLDFPDRVRVCRFFCWSVTMETPKYALPPHWSWSFFVCWLASAVFTLMCNMRAM